MNFVWMTSSVTRPVAAAPRPFTTARHAASPAPRIRRQWRTIPACESVNAVKTPIT